MTETTRPDPQVVAWMRAWRQRNDVTSGVARPRAIRAWMAAHGYDSFAVSPYDLGDLVAACRAAERALTAADIRAASLFIAGVRSPDDDEPPVPSPKGQAWLWFKDVDGTLYMVEREPSPMATAYHWARWNHLAATLPHVTVDEAP